MSARSIVDLDPEERDWLGWRFSMFAAEKGGGGAASPEGNR
jgi:hypothetical protein